MRPVSQAEAAKFRAVFGALCDERFDSTKTDCEGATYECGEGVSCGTTTSSVLVKDKLTGTRKLTDKPCNSATRKCMGQDVTCGTAHSDEHCA